MSAFPLLLVTVSAYVGTYVVLRVSDSIRVPLPGPYGFISTGPLQTRPRQQIALRSLFRPCIHAEWWLRAE
jgi:hypothetical protein